MFKFKYSWLTYDHYLRFALSLRTTSSWGTIKKAAFTVRAQINQVHVCMWNAMHTWFVTFIIVSNTRCVPLKRARVLDRRIQSHVCPSQAPVHKHGSAWEVGRTTWVRIMFQPLVIMKISCLVFQRLIWQNRSSSCVKSVTVVEELCRVKVANAASS